MQASRPADEDRLPWLEPYRETNAQKQRVARRSHGGLVAFAGALTVLIVAGGGGFWLGQRSDMPAAPRSSETIALPAPKPQAQPQPQAPPVQVAEALPAEPQPTVEQAAPKPVKVTKPAARKKAAKRKPAPRKKIRSANTQQRRLNAVRATQQRRSASRRWPRMPSPGPAGQVIQLGAFSTPARANVAYSQRIARYPLLARMPRVVVPVITKPDRRVLYVLRLGTTSRQQSKIVCGNLQASGDHCLVIG